MTPTTSVGDLAANDIGNTELILRHEGSTVSGVLRSLDIDVETITDTNLCEPPKVWTVAVRVTVTIGAITLGPLPRDHACEVIA